MQAASDIPEVGKVEVSWVANNGSVVAAAPAATKIKTEPVGTEKEKKVEGHVNGEGDKGSGVVRDADYDVADDEDRWMAG